MATNLTVHTIVKNEEQWVWYALSSVINYVSKLIIYDTGSIDKTVEIIKSIKSEKILFEEKGEVSAEKLIYLRNEQIERTKTDWFLLLDGDEIWSESAIKALTRLINRADDKIIGVVVKARLPVGDLFHYQGEEAGNYSLLDKKGHYNIRAYRRKKGYRWRGIYPLEAYVDGQGRPINTQSEKLIFLKKQEYWHLRLLPRSSIRHLEAKLEIGRPEKVKLPQVFFHQRPRVVPSPWVKFSILDQFMATIITPLLRLKRAMLNRG